jgi:hypothetical protein
MSTDAPSANGHAPTVRALAFNPAPAARASEAAASAPGSAVAAVARKLTLRSVLIASAALLLAALAAAEGIVSWHGQYSFLIAIKHQELSAALEALGPDCGAVIFALLGVALALLGRRAITERILVCACSGLSIVMNLGAANLGSPRAIGAYVMPPVLFAVTSDRLIATIRLAAIGKDDSRSAWQTLARIPLWILRLAFAPVTTVAGARRALLAATPLPEDAKPEPSPVVTWMPLPGIPRPAPQLTQQRPAIEAPRRKTAGRKPSGLSKTRRFLDLVIAERGPLASFPIAEVSRTAAALAPRVGLDAGAARTALRKTVLAAQEGLELS